eukprot:scaffold9738_cov38-Cyclotella_meneghiniana.AAC.1
MSATSDIIACQQHANKITITMAINAIMMVFDAIGREGRGAAVAGGCERELSHRGINPTWLVSLKGLYG